MTELMINLATCCCCCYYLSFFYMCSLMQFNEICCLYTGFIGEGVGFADRECTVWYMLFIIFVPYAMLPLPLKWCIIGGSISGAAHLIAISIVKVERTMVSFTFLYFFGLNTNSTAERYKKKKINTIYMRLFFYSMNLHFITICRIYIFRIQNV